MESKNQNIGKMWKKEMQAMWIESQNVEAYIEYSEWIKNGKQTQEKMIDILGEEG